MNSPIIVRSPILPLCINSLVKHNKISTVNKLIDLSYKDAVSYSFSDISTSYYAKKLKYYLRASYRTTQFDDMVDEFLMNSPYQKNQINQNKKIEKQYISNKHNTDVKLELNPFIYKYTDNIFLVFTSKSSIKKIESNFFTQSINSLLNKQKYTYNNLISILCKQLSLSEEIVRESVDDLINNEFLLMQNRTLKKFGRKNGFIDKSISSLSEVKLDDSMIAYTESVMRALLSGVYYEGYSTSVNNFVEKYGENLVPLEVLIKDPEFIKNILTIKSEVAPNSTFITFIKEKQQEAILLNKQVINVNWKELKKHVLSEKNESDQGFDLFFHLYLKNEKKIIDIDTGHNIFNSGKSHSFFKTESDIIEYNFFDDTIWYLTRKNKSNEEKIISEGFSRYFIGVAENNEFFVYDSVKRCPVNLIAKNNLNLNLYPIPFQLLLICSNKNNLTCNIRNKFLLKDSFFSPEVRINNMILNKKTWNFSSLKYNVSSFEKFTLFIEQLIGNNLISTEVVLMNEDIQSLYNLKIIEDLKFLYSQVKKGKEVILKENLQEYSPIYINNLTHANQCIISFPPREITKSKYISRNLLNNDNQYNEELFYTIKLIADEYHSNKDLHRIKDELIKKVSIKHYFWINYKNTRGNLEVRLRVKADYIPKLLLEFENIRKSGVHIKIERYYYESYRYYNIGNRVFKKFSIYDSYFYDNIAKAFYDEISNIIINTNTWLAAFYDDSLISKVKVLEKYHTIKRNNELKAYVQKNKNKIYEKKLMKLQEIISREKLSVVPIQEIQSLIHISNNRIIGTNTKLEREIYKEILLSFKETIYKNGIL